MPACVACDEVITQPICANCLREEIATWLQERVPERPELLLRLEELTEEILAFGGETGCIKCRNPMSLCSHCYTEHIYAWVVEQFPRLAPEFRMHFSAYPEGDEYAPGEMLYAQ